MTDDTIPPIAYKMNMVVEMSMSCFFHLELLRDLMYSDAASSASGMMFLALSMFACVQITGRALMAKYSFVVGMNAFDNCNDIAMTNAMTIDFLAIDPIADAS